MPIFPLKARYNKTNYSLDGADGPAIEVSTSNDYAEVVNDIADDTVSEDVVFDPLIYDYVLPAPKEVDALTILPAPDRGELRLNGLIQSSTSGINNQSSIHI